MKLRLIEVAQTTFGSRSLCFAERFVYVNVSAYVYEEAATKGYIGLTRYFKGHNKQGISMEMTGMHVIPISVVYIH